MDSDFQPYTPGPQQDRDPYATQKVVTPPEVTGPVETDRTGTEPTPGHHDAHRGHGGGGHWMHLLMCAPMIVVVAYLVLAGRAGGGAILYAVGCLAMMGAMMAMMNHGSGNHGSGHRH